MDYKKEEIKQYFDDYIEDNEEWLKESKHWKDDLHHNAFNTDYYIIGTYKAKQWLGDTDQELIEIIKKGEKL
jgi:outer membrane protease